MSDVLTSSRSPVNPAGPIAGSLAMLREALAAEAPALAPRLDALMEEVAAETGWASVSSACDAIPEIDYDLHPYYRTLAGDDALRAEAADRFFRDLRGHGSRGEGDGQPVRRARSGSVG